jgi:hypothetical protein
MKSIKRGTVATILLGALVLQVWPSSAAPGLVVGAGVWNQGGRVSTLEMVGLNPQPEPPSRTAVVIHTSGATVVLITITCAARPDPSVYLATGRGNNGRFYAIRIEDRGALAIPGLPDRGDTVGFASYEFPPSPCQEPGNRVSLVAGDFIVR